MTLHAGPAGHRIGVFGGAFDPPHVGHARLLQAAQAQLALDRLVVLPTGLAWHKQRTLSDAAHRLAMARLAFDGLPGVVVDGRELNRPGPTYTVDTLTELHSAHPDAQLYLLMGQDQWSRFGTWHRAQDIARLAIICVASRADLTGAGAPFGPNSAPPVHIDMAALDLSSTAIRSAAARHDRLDGLVFAPVARYIEQHHLYQNA